MNIEYRNELPDGHSFFTLYQTTNWDKENRKQEQQLNKCIINADLNGLSNLMTEDYVFCDTANNRMITI